MDKYLSKFPKDFGQSKRYKGIITSVTIENIYGTISKILTISYVKQYNTITNRYEPFHIPETEPSIQVILKKLWVQIDLFAGLEIGLFGNFLENTNSNNQKIMKIPCSSSFNNSAEFNFIVIEPSL